MVSTVYLFFVLRVFTNGMDNCREAVSNLWVNLMHSSDSDVAVTERRRRITIASVWFVLTLVLALVSPDIGSVIDMLGSLAAIFIFVFPGNSCYSIIQ